MMPYLLIILKMILCTASSYETRGASYIWRKAWFALTDNDKLFSGNIVKTYVYYLILNLIGPLGIVSKWNNLLYCLRKTNFPS